MKFEKSCGMVVFTRIANENRYVLVQSKTGCFGFPKGHIEGNETERGTAQREVFEEVHLTPTILNGFREVSEYFIPNTGVKKQVIFFLGSYKSQEIIVQDSELKGAVLVSFNDAMSLLQYDNDKKILTKADSFLRLLDEKS